MSKCYILLLEVPDTEQEHCSKLVFILSQKMNHQSSLIRSEGSVETRLETLFSVFFMPAEWADPDSDAATGPTNSRSARWPKPNRCSCTEQPAGAAAAAVLTGKSAECHSKSVFLHPCALFSSEETHHIL